MMRGSMEADARGSDGDSVLIVRSSLFLSYRAVRRLRKRDDRRIARALFDQ